MTDKSSFIIPHIRLFLTMGAANGLAGAIKGCVAAWATAGDAIIPVPTAVAANAAAAVEAEFFRKSLLCIKY